MAHRLIQSKTLYKLLHTIEEKDLIHRTYKSVWGFYARNKEYNRPKLGRTEMYANLTAETVMDGDKTCEWNVIVKPKRRTLDPARQPVKIQLQYYGKHQVEDREEWGYDTFHPNLEEILEWHWVHSADLKNMDIALQKFKFKVGMWSPKEVEYYGDIIVSSETIGEVILPFRPFKIGVKETSYDRYTPNIEYLTVDLRLDVN